MKLLSIKDLHGSTAVLGGSFDPIHNGHLHIAEQVIKWSGADTVLFVPNGNHHFKKGLVQLCFADRFALIKQAINGHPHFSLSNADRSGTGYTAHLMQNIKKDNPETHYVFIIGSDNLENLPNWFDFTWLQQNLHFLILPRPGYQIDLDFLKQIKASLLPIELSPISATDIRQRIKNGESIKGLVPECIEKKVLELYGDVGVERSRG